MDNFKLIYAVWPIFRTLGKKKLFNKDGYLLIICDRIDVEPLMEIYVSEKDQEKTVQSISFLITKLNNNIKKKTKIRLNDSFYKNKVSELLKVNELFIVSFMSPAFCIDPTCGPQIDTLYELGDKYRSLPIVHIETYLNPVELKNDFDKKKINPVIREWGVDEGQWLYVVSKSGMIIAKFQGYASLEQIEEYIN